LKARRVLAHSYLFGFYFFDEGEAAFKKDLQAAVVVELGTRWKALALEQKDPFEERARKEKEQTRKAEKEAARHAVGSSSAYSSHAAPEPHQVDPLPVLYLLRPGQL
jgi:hypothetical protein